MSEENLEDLLCLFCTKTGPRLVTEITDKLLSQAANLALARGQMPVDFGRASEKIGVF